MRYKNKEARRKGGHDRKRRTVNEGTAAGRPGVRQIRGAPASPKYRASTPKTAKFIAWDDRTGHDPLGASSSFASMHGLGGPWGGAFGATPFFSWKHGERETGKACRGRKPSRPTERKEREMAIVVECQCGKKLKVPDASVGKKLRCPGCRTVFSATGEVVDNVEGSASLSAKNNAMQPCLFCGEKIPEFATICGYCQEPVGKGDSSRGPEISASDETMTKEGEEQDKMAKRGLWYGMASLAGFLGSLVGFAHPLLNISLCLCALVFSVNGRRSSKYKRRATIGLWLGAIAILPAIVMAISEYSKSVYERKMAVLNENLSPEETSRRLDSISKYCAHCGDNLVASKTMKTPGRNVSISREVFIYCERCFMTVKPRDLKR